MGNKENFNQAMHEVFSFRKNAKDPENSAEPGQAAQAGPSSRSNLAEDVGREPGQGPGVVDFQSAYEAKIQQSIETTRITKDTRITGTIVSKSHLDIDGDVFGDVESQNDIYLSGKVEGNLKGKNVEISHAKIKGDIHAAEHLTVAEQSEIMGNIFAGELDFNSKISGSITVKNSANILRDSAIVGDITAVSVNIEKGAVLKSMMNITGAPKISDGEE